MRALLALLLVAGGAYWVWLRLDGTGDPGAVNAAVAAAERQRAAATVASEELPPASSPPASSPPPAAPVVAGLLAKLSAREPGVVQAAWTALAVGAGPDAPALAKALQPAGDDVAAALAALGPDNACLHSAEGRAMVATASALVQGRPDAEALAFGTQLLGVLLKGRILQSDTPARAAVDAVYKQHLVRVERWLFDPANVAGCRSHTVASGDSLARIASRFRKEGIKIEDGTLAIVNRIHNPKALAVGQKIKIPAAPLVAVLEKRSFALAVYLGEHLIRMYWVGHGANDHTPVTEFTVGPKQARPDWTAPDGQVYGYGHPKNILGEYFIKFLHESYVGFGAHGTPQPETIGTMSSMGCIRMYAPDIEELFRLLPVGSKVVVRATESLRS
jgi:lipoprotein-anchoring transpeptidase ErfK/SrfK